MKPVINPAWPIEAVTGIDQLMAIAVGMEREAAERYEQLAGEMERAHEPELAALFRRLAALEREHEAGLGRWAQRDGLAAPQPLHFSWHFPETFGTEADGDEAHVLTPYRALGVAVRNEERAFAFYAYLSAMAPDDAVRRRADALAREELNHVAELRAMRRRAFHAARTPPVTIPRCRDDLRRLAASLEAGAARLAGIAAETAARAGFGHAADVLQRLTAEARQRAEGFGDGAGDQASAALQGAEAAGLLDAAMLTPFGALRLALRNAEDILETYMATAESASDPAVLQDAQALAEVAVARLALIRSQLAEVEG